LGASVEDQFGRYSDWNQVMGVCGPFDQPRFAFEQGRTFYQARLHLQSIRTIKRVTELAPTNFVAKVWLADLYLIFRRPDEALELLRSMRANPQAYQLDAQREQNLSRIEATALLAKGDKDDAAEVLRKALAQPEVGAAFRAVAANLYLQAGLNAEAVPLLQAVLVETPEDIRALANLGYTYLQLEKYSDAEQTLSRALELDPENGVVRLNRAIVRLRAKNYDLAETDYEVLQQQFPKAYQVWYGLGEIAFARNDLAKATAHFTECMKFTAPGTPDYLQVSNRLAAIQAGSK
jgi:tetratricopeptide (TPR) repeat protein